MDVRTVCPPSPSPDGENRKLRGGGECEATAQGAPDNKSGSSLGAVFAALCWSRIELPRTAYVWILLCLCDFSDSLGNNTHGTPKFASFSCLGLE
uniref:Uncharacterized protein n=1 Tax=Mus spicilegus TaxID=10103 RepID=A0A8C6HPY0_MUSSI